MIRFTDTLRAAALAVAGALCLCVTAPTASAQSTSVKVDLGGSGPASRSLSLPRGKSAIVDLPVDARDVLVSNPAVADAVLRTPRRIYVLGVAPGQTDAVFFDGMGRQILSLDIRVDQPTGALEDTLRRIAPGADIHVEAVNDSLVLTGMVANAGENDRVQRIAERFVAKPEQVLNMMTIKGADQVMLRVRVVEMQRSMIKQLGFNTQAVLGKMTGTQFALANAPTFAINGSFAGGTTATVSGGTNPTTAPACSGSAKIIASTECGSGMIQAFERAGLARTLAEPNLSAVSGESAKFLAGGEFPVPTGLDQNGNVTVQYKQFGVALAFTPVVMGDGRISLKVATEVSELTSEGALQFNNTLTVPGLSVRRAETTLEMPSGGAMMIAGLLREQTKQNIDGVPGMKDLPVLGALFRSRDYLAGETELVIIVEPYLVTPTSPDKLQTPVDGLEIASDIDTTFRGRLNKVYGDRQAPPARGSGAGAPASAQAPAWQGPVGYVID